MALDPELLRLPRRMSLGHFAKPFEDEAVSEAPCEVRSAYDFACKKKYLQMRVERGSIVFD